MLFNSSSNFSFPQSPLVCSVNTSIYPTMFDCFSESRFSINMITFTLIYLLLIVPLYILVLWIGFQQWKHGSSRATSHTDVFTYCIATVEAVTTIGLLWYNFAIYVCQHSEMVVGYYCLFFSWIAQTFFHFLTCVERYVAVVHPITYMGLKASQGIVIRNLSIGCVYLLCFIMLGFAGIVFPIFPSIACFFMLGLITLAVCFLSLAVFFVLSRPGLGSDKSKRKAFRTIMVITGALLLRFGAQGVSIIIIKSVHEGELGDCENFLMTNWFCLPCSLVMPLLFLQRKGKLTCFASILNQKGVDIT